MKNKQHKLDFIIKAVGGDSLSYVLKALDGGVNARLCFHKPINSHEAHLCFGYGSYGDYLSWQLLIDTKEAKLQDQSDETINSLATILGYEND